MVGAAVAASCAFMLPVATPPNAVVFGSGYLKIQDMVTRGVIMNIFSIILISLMVYLILPIVWGIELSLFSRYTKTLIKFLGLNFSESITYSTVKSKYLFG